MFSIKNTLMFFLLLLSFTFAAGLFGDQNLKESQVVITPQGDGKVIEVSLLVFEPATSQTGTTIREIMEQITKDCIAQNSIPVQTCIFNKATEMTSQSSEYKITLESLKDAHFLVQYFNPLANGNQGGWSPVEICKDIIATKEGTAKKPDGTEGTYYYVKCDLSNAVEGSSRTSFKVTFLPQAGQDISSSYSEYQYSNAQVSPATLFNSQINNFIASLAGSGGECVHTGNFVNGNDLQCASPGALPCIGIFLIMGLLVASVYFSGKSPVSLLDITTPKLPAPKGVAAGGQVLAPFGYTEMSRTIKGKLSAAATAVSASTAVLKGRYRGDSELSRLESAVKSQKGTAGDRAAGDIADGKKIATAIVTGGHMIGMSAAELYSLTKLPYNYDSADHKKVSEIVSALEKRGGREGLMGMTIKNYLNENEVLKRLEVLTAKSTAPGQRRSGYIKVTSALNKFVGVGRFATVGGLVMPTPDSVVRSGIIMKDIARAAVTELPHLARRTGRATMELIGGERSMKNLEYAAKSSGAAALAYDQLNKKPSTVSIQGRMHDVNADMAHLYMTLRDEITRDQMVYVIGQVYKKMGINFNLNEEEILSMGHKTLKINGVSVDILGRSNYHQSAEIAAVEAQMKTILANTSFTGIEKLHALTVMAESHAIGAYIDGRMISVADRVQTIETSVAGEHVKFLTLLQKLESENTIRMAAQKSVHNDDAYICHVGGESLTVSEAWKLRVLRTVVWDGENGYLRGGIREELLGAYVNNVNRFAGLGDNSKQMEHLPESQRNAAQLKAVAKMAHDAFVGLVTPEGEILFEKAKGKKVGQASIEELVDFRYGGTLQKSMTKDPVTGLPIYRSSDLELDAPRGAFYVDMKRHFFAGFNEREYFGISHFANGKYGGRAHVGAYDAEIAAEAKRLPGSATRSAAEEISLQKDLYVKKLFLADTERSFGSQFAHNAYGTTHETARQTIEQAKSMLMQAFDDKGLASNHPERMFLSKLDVTNPKHLTEFATLLTKHDKEYRAVMSREVTYDDVASSSRALVKLNDGTYVPYTPGMHLSDRDSIMAGAATLRDEKGVKRPFVPEDVAVKFEGRDDLARQYAEVQRSKDPNKWTAFLDNTTQWAKSGTYSFAKHAVLAAVLWQSASATHDYGRYWEQSGVTVEARRNITPLAPTPFRFFGEDGHSLARVTRPLRDIGMAIGDYISKVATIAADTPKGRGILSSSYDISAVSAAASIHSHTLVEGIETGRWGKLSDAEKRAYYTFAMKNSAREQASQWTLDRNPWGLSSSMGTHQSDVSRFYMGPAGNFDYRAHVGAFLTPGEKINFDAIYGFSLPINTSIARFYQNMFSTSQKAIHGAPGRFDSTGDPLRSMQHSSPRLREAMQAIFNPFASGWSDSWLSRALVKMNVVESSAAKRYTGGNAVLSGLSGSAQDFSDLKGAMVEARLGNINPAESVGSYRLDRLLHSRMASRLVAEQIGQFAYDKDVINASLNNIIPRTVQAEALAIQRNSEQRGYGIFQNDIFAHASPVLWPIHKLKLKDILTKVVSVHKEGHGWSFGDGLNRWGQDVAHRTSMLRYSVARISECPLCHTTRLRGSRCTTSACNGQVIA